MTSSISATPSQPSPESSLQRSALNISVGDTKSIVFALQALQSKIRQLEKDRDYHLDQYDNALRSHESFKAVMQVKMEEERAAHRRRECELSELLQQALDEKSRIHNSSLVNQGSFQPLREELDRMLNAEKKNAEEREGKLLLEIQELYQIIKQEKMEHAAVLMKLENLQKAQAKTPHEKNESPPRNEHREKVSVAHRHVQTIPSPKRGTSNTVRKRVSHHLDRRCHSNRSQRHHDAPSSTPRHGSPCCWTTEKMKTTERTASSLPFCLTNTYRDPTCNSMLRDVRNISGVSPCAHPSGFTDSTLLEDEHRTILDQSAPFGYTVKPEMQGPSSSTLRSRKNSITNSSPPFPRTFTNRRKGIEASEESLVKEIRTLKKHLQEFVVSPSLSQMSTDEMRSYFLRLRSQLQRKEEQLALLRQTKEHLNVVSDADGSRQALMNEMRAIVSNALDS